MSEIMTSEAIIEARWILEGYWTKPRYAYQTKKGGWSDIDVLSYNPETKHLVISESKVQGRSKAVFAWTKEYETLKGQKLHEWEEGSDNYLGFIGNLRTIVDDANIFSDFDKYVKKLTIHFVSNYVIAKDMEDKVKKDGSSPS